MFLRTTAFLTSVLLAVSCSSGSSDSSDPGDDGGGGAPPATTQDGLAALEQALRDGDGADLAEAARIFAEVLEDDPSDDLAKAMVAVLGPVVFLGEDPALASLLQRFGATGSPDAFGIFELEFPDTLPDDSPTLDELQAWLDQGLLPVLEESIALLDAIAPSFSRTLVFELDPDDPDDDVELTINYALTRLLAGGLRFVLALGETTQVFDLRADIDRIANHRFDVNSGLDVPYRIFAGPTPTSPGVGFTCPTDTFPPVDRAGIFNDPEATGPNFLLPAADAASHLAAVQTALAEGLRDLVEGVDLLVAGFDPASCGGVGDPDVDDLDLDALACAAAELIPFYDAGLRPWLLDLADALEGIDPNVASIDVEVDGEPFNLPAFTLDAALLFDPLTYGGRFFLPDYTLSREPCVADANSFPNPTLFGLLPGVKGEDWVLAWNLVNGLSDLLLVGQPLNTAY